MVLMVGDQIYADDLGPVAPDRLADEYNGRYRTVFTQPAIRGLMARVPTYMTLDDHEIEDNWPAKATHEDWMVKYPAAMHAYLTYQASHSPLFAMETPGELLGTPEKLWYTFSDGCCDFFFTDTRTERFLSADVAESEIISGTQMEALKNWLVDGSGRVKLVVTSVPLFPDSLVKAGDQWGGFPQQRGELLDFIRHEQLRKVVFLSGDLHAALTIELGSPEDAAFRVLSIVSSPFFWPYPHSSWGRLRLSGPLPAASEVVYELRNSSPVHISDCFTRVLVSPERLRADLYSRKGELLQTTAYEF
jgi:alkaline phosphatase D